jgi:hypothetical protein
MRAFGICSCVMLTGVMVGMVGCNKANNATATRIQITGCIATPDPQTVHDNSQVIWVPDVNYRITFLPTNTPNGPAVPVSSNPFTVVAGSTVPQVIHGPTNCSTAGCYYKYTLTKFNNGVPESVPCIDPGIRVIP